MFENTIFCQYSGGFENKTNKGIPSLTLFEECCVRSCFLHICSMIFFTSYLPRNIYVYPSIQFTQHLYPYIKQCLFISHEGKLRQNFLMLNFSPPNLNRPQSSSFLSIWPAPYLSIYPYTYLYPSIYYVLFLFPCPSNLSRSCISM